MTGWIGDFLHLWWALCYWNIRKTWFRLRGAARDSCPCQHPSDSGRALDTRCEAILHWHHPERFRRVCPLLQKTKDGWRCAVDAEQVRPFWGRAAAYAASLVLALYLGGTFAGFVALRALHFEVNYISVAWPPRWPGVTAAREQRYARRAQAALDAGNFGEALLWLDQVCQVNPRNHAAGLALAGLALRAAQSPMADATYERLLRDVPEARAQTAAIWYHSLLARLEYARIKPLAAEMLAEDTAHRSAWLYALLSAARETGDRAMLADLGRERSSIPDWCRTLLAMEAALLDGRPADALPRLRQVDQSVAAGSVAYFQVDQLLRFGRAEEALHLLEAYGSRVAPDEAAFLRLRAYRATGWHSLVDSEQENILQFPLSPRLAAQLCASLIRDPDPAFLAAYLTRFNRERPALTDETLPLYHATCLAAILAGDNPRADQLAGDLKRRTGLEPQVLHGVAELIRTQRDDKRLGRVLPLVALPIEVIYAAVERHPAFTRR